MCMCVSRAALDRLNKWRRCKKFVAIQKHAAAAPRAAAAPHVSGGDDDDEDTADRYLDEDAADAVEGEGGADLPKESKSLGRWYGYVATEDGYATPLANPHYNTIDAPTVIDMLRYIHRARPEQDDPSFLALARVLVDRLLCEKDGIASGQLCALPISYAPVLRRSHLAIGPVIPDSFDGVSAVQLVPQRTRLCGPLVFLRGVLHLVHRRARTCAELRKKVEGLDATLRKLGISTVPGLTAMRRYRSEKDPLLVRSRKRAIDVDSDRLCKLREWCRLGELIVAHATYLQRLESARPADADLLTRIEWLVPLPWVWESYVKLQLRERFKKESIDLGSHGRISFQVTRLKEDIPHRFFPSKKARPDIVVWVLHAATGERRPIAVFDAKLYREASRKAHDSHLWQVIAYANALERQHTRTAWWPGEVAVGGLVYGYWAVKREDEPQPGVAQRPWTEHCCHIDLRGANVAQSADPDPEAALDKLVEGSLERIEELLMG